MHESSRIYICFKENAKPKKIFQELKTNLALQYFTPTQKVGFRRIFKSAKVDLIETDKQNIKPQTFRQRYAQMSYDEKRLYRIWKIEFAEKLELEAVLKEIEQHPDIEYVQEEIYHKTCDYPIDPEFPRQYALPMINCLEAWEISNGQEVIVAVIDTGVDYNHPDLKEQMWQSPQGRFGFDFSGDKPNPSQDSDPMDTHGHGTHIAGIIAAIGNSIGIIGVAPKAKIMALKVFPHGRSSVDIIADALKYSVDNGAQVINCSWAPESRAPKSPVIEEAVSYVTKKGGICVFAAGNLNDDVSYYSPANKPYTISVGAIDQDSNRYTQSNFGALIDVAAPGVEIFSLKHKTDNYTALTGTSQATAHVSGLIALLLAANPALTFVEILTSLINSAAPINTDKPIGKGRINCLDALKLVVPTPLPA